MVAANLRLETMKLMDEKKNMEDEMNGIMMLLCQSGGPGIYGNLVDSQGFPRSDIDIPAVLSQRHRLAELKNDYGAIVKKIEQNIQILHSAKPGPSSSPRTDAGETESSNNQGQGSSVIADVASQSTSVFQSNISTSMDMDPYDGIPFVLVDEISDASPAAEDGLQLGDQILKFGNVVAGDHLLHRLAAESQINQGYPISVVVLRHGTQVNLTVTPRLWEGLGLLGCHFRIL